MLIRWIPGWSLRDSAPGRGWGLGTLQFVQSTSSDYVVCRSQSENHWPFRHGTWWARNLQIPCATFLFYLTCNGSVHSSLACKISYRPHWRRQKWHLLHSSITTGRGHEGTYKRSTWRLDKALSLPQIKPSSLPKQKPTRNTFQKGKLSKEHLPLRTITIRILNTAIVCILMTQVSLNWKD